MVKRINNIPLEQIVAKVASLGVPGLVLVIAINATGLAGGAAIMAALASIGPGGALMGIATLGVISLVSQGIVTYGTETILDGVIKELYLRGETKETIKQKIQAYPISKKMKLALYDRLDSFTLDKYVMVAQVNVLSENT